MLQREREASQQGVPRTAYRNGLDVHEDGEHGTTQQGGFAATPVTKHLRVVRLSD